MEEDGEMTFFCGNEDEILYWVNDEYEDCEDGSDEQQYDEDGDPINWFDCMDGCEVWIYQVNDGNFDCPDGEDEYSNPPGMARSTSTTTRPPTTTGMWSGTWRSPKTPVYDD